MFRIPLVVGCLLLLVATGCQKETDVRAEAPDLQRPAGAGPEAAGPVPQDQYDSPQPFPAEGADDFPRPVETPMETADDDRPQPIDVEPRGPAHQIHVVRKGDTLFSLAKTYLGDGRLWKRIAQANNIQDPSNLSVGTRLVIPGQ